MKLCPKAFTASLLLCSLLCAAISAEEIPGGLIQVRQSLTSERGSLPVVVVQTVPEATTTATTLAIRYAQAGKKAPKSGLAHLLEHLLFRTEPGGKPGELLLRSEIQGDRSRAWVSTEFLVLSEEVPSESGLESLGVQVKRLSGAPKDPEGLKLEKQTLRQEISKVQSPEELGRRKVLSALGLDGQVEGDSASLSTLRTEDLDSLLSGLNLETDVVISVVGPHSPREVRQILSQKLHPLAPARVNLREDREKSREPISDLLVESPRGFSQKSLFFEYQPKDPRSLRVAQALLKSKLGTGSQAKLEQEAQNLYRLDLSPATGSIDAAMLDLSDTESEKLFTELKLSWLDLFDSSLERAEMIALNHLQGQSPEGPVTKTDFPVLVQEAKQLLAASQRPRASLILKPSSAGVEDGLFAFQSRANRTPDTPLESKKLPNELKISIQRLQTWPVLALSGFFRITPALTPEQVASLESTLNSREDLKMQYELTPSGLFFSHWGPSERGSELLIEGAQELRKLGLEESELLSALPTVQAGLVEEFFLGEAAASSQQKEFKSKIFDPQDAHLVVVGQFTEEQLDQGLRPAWSGWFRDETNRSLSSAAVTAALPELAQSKILSSPHGTEPLLLIGLEGPTRGSQDFLAFNLALQTLAGRPRTSIFARKFQEAETGVSSVTLFPLASSIRHGQKQTSQIWIIALRLSKNLADPGPVVKKVEALLSDLKNQAMASAELDRTRSYLKSSLALSAATARGRARVLAHAEFFRLSESYTQDFAGLYDNLTPELVRSVCQRQLQSELRWLYLKPDSGED